MTSSAWNLAETRTSLGIISEGSFQMIENNLYVVSAYGTTSTVAIKSYLQISQNSVLMVPILFKRNARWVGLVRGEQLN
ncbi:MAG: hypothetical protein CMQ21_15050 [Gammaproteobacteria bacterium]|jgi:hypothetical protein|nr:hypothetical protein [Gammaproteobacteria bacterium]